eukprot:3778995-Pleurochrysis_carterae.AAC.2
MKYFDPCASSSATLRRRHHVRRGEGDVASRDGWQAVRGHRTLVWRALLHASDVRADPRAGGRIEEAAAAAAV